MQNRTRRSWRFHLIVLVALAPLMQGCWLAGNPSLFTATAPTVNVPGVGEVFLSKDGDSYVLKVEDPSTHKYVRIGPGDPRYPLIDAFFRSRQPPCRGRCAR